MEKKGRVAIGICKSGPNEGKKFILKSQLIESMAKAECKEVYKELKLMQMVPHPFILPVVDVSVVNQQHFMVVTEHCEPGDLSKNL